jgi:methionine-S-sulfoxide reductase
MEQAILAAGCFWGVQYYLDQVPGVEETIVGYSGGYTDNPTYEEVVSHSTGHAEAVLVKFNNDELSFETLLKHFFRLHNPTQLNRQGPDIGENYRSAIFYLTDEQKETAERVTDELKDQYDQPIVTLIEQAGPFYPAEDYHQKFTERTGRGMCHVAYTPIG